MNRWLRVATLALLLWALALPARAAERLPKELEGITVTEHLGQKANVNQTFTDATGKKVQLRDYFDGKRPVLLTLNYYRCPMLCNLQLNALTEGMRGLQWTPGQQYRVVTISIDDRETPDLARGKRATHLQMLGRGDVDWAFLVGDKDAIRAVADSVGFGYRYDPDGDQWAHPAVATFLSPDGTITRYLYGLEYPSRDLKFALMEASQGRVGSTVDKLILSCFHYDAANGSYAPFAFGIMRLGAIATVVALGGLLLLLWRHDVRKRRDRDASGSAEPEEA